ncbi:uncharacterized protein [Blastocystis hominis]|uniref:RRM domain-containing protein n=1 Tax=Blastocystis hominis TaxID=12968 RepID=D8M9A6_BLAHO|nr:uncharacterized protein [Blastocystis hominis]CBK24645.2 unnamed protein product [Blastocystis hominis]|eukprot:XP_012898693.1 uncharacterized protein [Blastocystis hominis]
MNYEHPERCVFIGNIPYEAPEEKVREIMESIKKDPKTGKNKGIGFCEFLDQQTAEQAMKMNNEKEIDGRPLRIDFPDGGKQGKKDSTTRSYCSYITQADAYQLLRQTKNMIKEDPARAKMILVNHPNITRVLEELIRFNNIK